VIFWVFVPFWTFGSGHPGGTNMMNKYLSKFSSPAGKLVKFFERSRDGWKAKQQKLKEQQKLLQNQTRAVEKSRDEWRKRASEAQQRVKELEREVEELKSRRCSASPR
jgi:Skp family chaperone for outer membrane proteins